MTDVKDETKKEEQEEPKDDAPPPTLKLGGEFHISAEDGRDVGKYRFAKSKAAESGQSLIIDPPAAREPITHPAGTVVIPFNATPREYRQMKADAERRGVPFTIQER